MIGTSQVIDVDHPASWPTVVSLHAQDLADALRGTTESTTDLPIPRDMEDEFRSLLSGHLVRAYHATRLLDHEVESIRRQGLRTLSVELMTERIEAAHAHGHISDAERARLHQAHVFAEGNQQGREGNVSLFLGRSILDAVHDVARLLGTWGGEGIYMSGGGYAMRPRLEQLGRPSIVVASIDVSASWRTLQICPRLQKLFVGQVLGLHDVGADVFSPRPIPPDQIAGVWQPGMAAYDQFNKLPRA